MLKLEINNNLIGQATSWNIILDSKNIRISYLSLRWSK